MTSDLAVLEAREPRADLPCEIDPTPPRLGFDMRYHAGYALSLPLENLAGTAGQLRILFRVSALDRQARDYYFADRIKLPPIDAEAKGRIALRGEFLLGPGLYRVDWLMRDSRERVCARSWETAAEPRGDEKDLVLALPAGAAAERSDDPFQEQSPAQRLEDSRLLHVKILVNLSPPDPSAGLIRDRDIQAIVSIVRGIARQPGIGTFHVIAFTMVGERVLYRSGHQPFIDFPALGDALKGIEFGVVDYRRLHEPGGETGFLAALLAERSAPDEPDPDALMIVGPKLALYESPPREVLLAAGFPGYPVFYLNYADNPARNPWRDSISLAVKILRGLEYSISAPRDLGAALGEMMLQVRSKARNRR